MNKRFSTLLGASLLLSSAFGGAWAQTLNVGNIADKLEAGKYYHLVMNNQATEVTSVNSEAWAYGFKSFSAETNEITPTHIAVGSETTEGVDPEMYLWSVSEVNVSVTSTPKYALVLTNKKTGKVLRFKDGQAEMTVTDNKATDKIVWGADWLKYGDEGAWVSRRAFIASSLSEATEGTPVKSLILAGDVLQEDANNNNYVFSICEAATEDVSDTELNQLYNSAGFNLKLDDKYKDVTNIFADSRIKAIDVDGVDVEAGYSFPEGTYFAVSTPAGSYKDLNNNADRLAYLMDCEFIAVSSTENISQSATEQKEGRGFVFTTISGRDLNKYTVVNKDLIDPAKQAKNSEISVFNACFKVQKNATVSGKYALSLPKFRYEASSGKYDEKGNLIVSIAEKKYGSNDYLTTQTSSTPDFIFSFVESNVVKPAEFLKTDGAAIYNIRFVNEDGDEKSENDKYLFAPAYGYQYSNFYAKGQVLFDENDPEYQFVITNVNGNNITFTSRANKNMSFTAQLFDEGENKYSLALSSALMSNTAQILNIDEAGNVVNGDLINLHCRNIVLETPESTDMFNGALNVANESKVTLSFARDNEPTSNKIYPTVKQSSGVYVLNTGINSADVSEAAQWQLVKSEKPKYLTQTYAFKNDKGTVEYRSLGDTVAYYTYNIELVADGYAQKRYLNENTGNYSLSSSKDDFVIKENVDGSVLILSSYNDGAALSILGYNNSGNDLNEYLNNHPMIKLQNSEVSKAKNIKTYLLSEAPEISWKGENGHVTIQSELGNYITMNDERDGIVVNTTEDVMYLHATDKKAVVPSFFISKGIGEGNAESERMYLFNPTDSINYYVGEGKYDKLYQVPEGATKAIFKSGKLNANADTLNTTIKGKDVNVAMKADNKGTQGGLNKFKFQIVESADADGLYYIRQNGKYLYSINDKLVFGGKSSAMKFNVEGASAPTSNESVSASEVKVVANNGSVVVKNAAGKNVVVSTILGQVVANEVLTSDNATINVPAGIVVVAVEGESFKVNVK